MDDFSSIDVVELALAIEDAIPGVSFTDVTDLDDILRYLRGLGDDSAASVMAKARQRGPKGRGGAEASPD